MKIKANLSGPNDEQATITFECEADTEDDAREQFYEYLNGDWGIYKMYEVEEA